MAALQRMSAIEHEPAAPEQDENLDDSAMDTSWEMTPASRNQVYQAKIDTSIRGVASDALDSWMYNNRCTLDMFCQLVKPSKNVSSRFGKICIGNGVFALALLWMLGFRWEVLDTEDGRALTFLPRAAADIHKGVCWKKARHDCLQSLVDALGLSFTVGKKASLTDVIGATPYYVHFHKPETAYLTIELRNKVAAK